MRGGRVKDGVGKKEERINKVEEEYLERDRNRRERMTCREKK